MRRRQTLRPLCPSPCPLSVPPVPALPPRDCAPQRLGHPDAILASENLKTDLHSTGRPNSSTFDYSVRLPPRLRTQPQPAKHCNPDKSCHQDLAPPSSFHPAESSTVASYRVHRDLSLAENCKNLVPFVSGQARGGATRESCLPTILLLSIIPVCVDASIQHCS